MVNGDSAHDRWAVEGYLPLVNIVFDVGISIFNWGKSGAGASKGTCCTTPCTDWSDETVAALVAVQQVTDVEGRAAGSTRC